MGDDDQKIDAVIAWVDGKDPAHIKKRRLYSNQIPSDRTDIIPIGKSDTRFLDNGELYYCLRFLLKNASWINHVYIITDNQVPHFLEYDDFLKKKCTIVDHKDLFGEFSCYLPTFNSRSIESLLWRVPGVSEKFIYLNDDFLVVNSVSPEDFFYKGKVVIRGSWRWYFNLGKVQLIYERLFSWLVYRLFKRNRTLHLLAQKKAAQIAGFHARYLRVPHVPHAICKNTLFEFFVNKKSYLEDNVSYRFRSSEQFWAISLSDHLNIRKGEAKVVNDGDWLEFNGEVHAAKDLPLIESRIVSGDIRFLCLASIEKADKDAQESLFSMLNKLLNSGVET